ncbi:MAG: hypothetical protein M2R45_01547 [Verrucomicrobia subdivision 3 bacterium]|nr:hypothetical protein [Limisphaerales bacterium]MCS1413325.1 hypothetical protein [Limisphaerales bacterium]
MTGRPGVFALSVPAKYAHSERGQGANVAVCKRAGECRRLAFYRTRQRAPRPVPLHMLNPGEHGSLAGWWQRAAQAAIVVRTRCCNSVDHSLERFSGILNYTNY